jgi:uncharacterized protein (TIGR00251 family)
MLFIPDNVSAGSPPPPFFHEMPQGIVVDIYVQPRSSRNRIVGLHGNALKIAIQAPPVDDAANRMCVQFLSDYLNVPRSSIEIIAGHASRTKRVCLHASSDKHGADHIEACKSKLLSLIGMSVSDVSPNAKKKNLT